MSRGCMNGFAFCIAFPFLWFVPPPDLGLARILLLSVLIHGLYPFFLVEAYRNSDLSHAFPIARGTTPLFVLLLNFFTLRQPLKTFDVAGILLISGAIAALAFEGGTHRSSLYGKFAAVATGLTIAAYTTVDAIGLRAAPQPYIYIVWLFAADGAFVASVMMLMRRGRVLGHLKREWRYTLVAGTLGVLSYGLALVALSMGTIAEIAALRETSVVFATLIGILLLKESYGTRRIMASIAIVAGAALLQIAG